MNASDRTTEYIKRKTVAVEGKMYAPILIACLPLVVWTYSEAQSNALTKQLSEQNTATIEKHSGRIRIVEQSAAVASVNFKTAVEAMRQIAYDVREIRKAQEKTR